VQSHCPTPLQTPVLIEQVERIRTAFDSSVHSSKATAGLLDQWLLSVCAVSPYVMRTLAQFPQILTRLVETGQLVHYPKRSTANADVAGLLATLQDDLRQAQSDSSSTPTLNSESIEMSVLRVFRHRQLVRILWQDLTGIACLEQTLYELSILAECCVQAADQWSYDALVKRFGTPRDDSGREQRLIIIGMGKLGGFELNVSSDIDLICLYAHSGSTETQESSQKSLDNGEFFRRSVQRLSKLLNSVTEEGFVYRVDTRLRPFGESGPLVMNFDGLENYYLTQARDWERYAMIKGRALCGQAHDVVAFGQLVLPFIYRRYLDYNAFESLRDIKRKIALSLLKSSMVDNIKLGAGGIREVEFIGQAFQLVRGGREPRLRVRSILRVLPLLSELALLPKHTLDDHQSKVSICFANLFAMEGEDDETDTFTSDKALEVEKDVWAALSTESIDEHERAGLLVSAGFVADESLLNSIDTLSRGSFYQRLTAESQSRVERIVPHILVLVKNTQDPTQTLVRMLALVRAVAGRGGYLQVLCDQPQALEHLVTLFSKSSWLAGFVARSPMVIDELLTQPTLAADAQTVFDETRTLVQSLLHSELDVQMDSLRHYRQAREMRIACAQLDGSLSLMQVSDQLSWLAESIIAGVLEIVIASLAKRYGQPGYVINEQTLHSQIGVLAYGKLGGLELGFSSDLDLVFVHDSTGTKQVTDGPKSVDNSFYYAKLAQGFVHFMGTKTPAGMLYEIDFRLRPNGNSGVLVIGIAAFSNYQNSDAWTWEHQALMRARMVFGSEHLRRRFDEIRQQVLTHNRPQAELRLAVANMRERMRSALGNKQPDLMHLKQDDGGVADIEFIVQYLVLAHAKEHPALLTFTDNIRVLDTIEQLALLPAEQCQILRSSYLALRERLHRQALDERSALVPFDDSLCDLKLHVVKLREQVLGAPANG